MQAHAYRPDVGRFLTQDRFDAAAGDLTLQSDPLTQNRCSGAGRPSTTTGSPRRRATDRPWLECLPPAGSDDGTVGSPTRGAFERLCGNEVTSLIGIRLLVEAFFGTTRAHKD